MTITNHSGIRKKVALVFFWIVGIIGSLLLIAGGIITWQWKHRETDQRLVAAPKSGRFIQSAEVELFIQEQGPVNGPPIIFIHGTGAWSGTWRPTMAAVAAAGYRAIALDLPPFGYSQRPDSGAYHVEDQAQRILGFIRTMKYDRVTLVGHSFGAKPTVEAALLSPATVRTLVLIDAALGLDDPPHTRPSVILSAPLRWRPLRTTLVAAAITNPRFTHFWLTRFIADPSAATSSVVRTYQQPFSLEQTSADMGLWMEQFLLDPDTSLSSTKTNYHALGMPVEAMWGDHDTITPLIQATHLIQLVPHGHLTVLPGLGHIPQLENPRQFTAALLSILATHTPISGVR